ncbi:MAG TPA: histidinol-phosphate transaminase [Mycobacteriales bacterium]|nr:histidinol-phosphate transaminase [Mycobacteriales bacterium]
MVRADSAGEGLAALPLRDDLRGLTPYGAPQLDVAVRLNTNENPYPPPPALVADLRAALTDAGGGLNRYPDREATELRAALGRYLGHPTEGIWAANGSNEVLQQLLQAFGGPGRTALGFEPSYSMHRLIAQATGTGWVAVDRAEDFSLSADDAVREVEEHQPDVVFLCSPNNPTATALPADVVTAVADAAPGMVIVDEAYVEFSHFPSAVGLLPGRPRLVVTRTMSKAFAMAGTRLGYLAADPAVVDALRLVRLPYHLSSLTQAAALVALAHADALLATVALLKSERDRVAAAVAGLGLQVVASDANFVLFGRFAAGRTWQRLLDKGVLVRDVSGGRHLAGWLRVSIGTPGENDAFLAALAEVCVTEHRVIEEQQ